MAQFPFYCSLENPPYLNLRLEDLETVKIRFKEINVEYNKNTIFKKQKLSCLIHLVYIDLTRFYTISESHKFVKSQTYLSTFRRLETLIRENYRSEKSVKFYADRLYISTKHLNRVTKNMVNKTSTKIIGERVILEAKRLLVHSEESLSDIAAYLGYKDYAHFSRVFKSKTKYTPTNFCGKYKSKPHF